MKKEIKVENKNGYVASYLTETKEFLHKKDCGWDMLGFTQIGKKRNTWIPISMNVKTITIYEAETGRRIETIDCKEYNR